MKNLLTTLLVFFFITLISCNNDDDVTKLTPIPEDPPPAEVGTYQGTLRIRDASSTYVNNMPVETIFDTSYTHEITVEIDNDSIFFKGFYQNQIIEFSYSSNGEYDRTSSPKDEFNIKFQTNDTLRIHCYQYGGSSGFEYNSSLQRFTGVKQ